MKTIALSTSVISAGVLVLIRILLDVIVVGRLKLKGGDNPQDKVSSAFFALFYWLAYLPAMALELTWRVQAFYFPLLAVFLAIYLSALALRAWTLRTLDEFYSVHIRISPEHTLVRSGPYRFFRHPIYLASILEMVALPLALSCYFAAALTALVWIPVILRRTAIEERILREAFGDEYDEFAGQVGFLGRKRASSETENRHGERT